MAAQGTYDGVLANAVCNQYINRIHGFKLDGEVVMPELHTEALKRANSSLPGTMSDMQLFKKLHKTRTDRKTGRFYITASGPTRTGYLRIRSPLLYPDELRTPGVCRALP